MTITQGLLLFLLAAVAGCLSSLLMNYLRRRWKL